MCVCVIHIHTTRTHAHTFCHLVFQKQHSHMTGAREVKDQLECTKEEKPNSFMGFYFFNSQYYLGKGYRQWLSWAEDKIGRII